MVQYVSSQDASFIQPKQKYEIGDRVIVVHRMDEPNYYSYVFEGSVGVIEKVDFALQPIYYVAHEDLVIAHTDSCYNAKEIAQIKRGAWYNECCLDPAPLPDAVEFKDFELVLG